MSPPENPIVHELHADDFVLGQEQGLWAVRFVALVCLSALHALHMLLSSAKRKRQRRRRLDLTIAEAEKGGKTVQAVTLPNGTKLDFSKAEQQGNELDQWIAKHADKTQRS
jgi:hypothetical protein